MEVGNAARMDWRVRVFERGGLEPSKLAKKLAASGLKGGDLIQFLTLYQNVRVCHISTDAVLVTRNFEHAVQLNQVGSTTVNADDPSKL